MSKSSITNDTITITLDDYSSGEDTLLLSDDYIGNVDISYDVNNNMTGSYIINSTGTAYDWANIALDPNLSGSTLNVRGDADIEGDLKIKGVSLNDRLDKIEERLAILRPNDDLESRWEKLKELGEQYRQLEKDILEKEKIWETLKK